MHHHVFRKALIVKTILNIYNVILRRLESILKRFEVKIPWKKFKNCSVPLFGGCFIYTSVRLIDYTESPADSETMRPDMEIPIVSSKTPTYPPSIPKKCRIYTYPIMEISTDFDSHAIIEYQIFCSIFPILQAIFG